MLRAWHTERTQEKVPVPLLNICVIRSTEQETGLWSGFPQGLSHTAGLQESQGEGMARGSQASLGPRPGWAGLVRIQATGP